MATATISSSRSMRIPLSTRQDTCQLPADDEWGPSSIPPMSNNSIPWDEQVVPALRKKLQAESNDLSKRISRIQDSQTGWAQVGDRRMSREVVKHNRESSIDQYHNRFASVRGPSRQKTDHVASSFPFDLAAPSSPSSISSEATQRAREKARQIAAKRAAQQQNGTSRDTVLSSSQGADSSIDVIPEHGSSFEYRRKRTQSTPMRPSVDLSNRTNGAEHPQIPATSTPNAHSHQRTISLSRRKAAAATVDPQLMAEFGPLGSTPSPGAKLMRAHLDPDASSSWIKQPDAFRSLPLARSVRETSAPPTCGANTSEFGVNVGASPASKSVSDWEEQIIPTVARKLQQEQFLASAGNSEGLIDTWDRNGLPLTQSDIRARKLQQHKAQEEEDREIERQEEQMLHAGPAAARENLSPIDGSFDARSRSRASSRRSYTSQPQQQQPQQQEGVEMQEMHSSQYQQYAQQQQTYYPPQMQHQQQQQVAATQHTKQSSWDDDKVEKTGCCCIVM